MLMLRPLRCLIIQTFELLAQYRALPFAESVVGSIDKVSVEPFARHPPTVMNRAEADFKVSVLRDNDPALTCRHQFAGLKTERATFAHRADFLSPPFTSVRVCAIFDEQEVAFLGDLLQAIHIAGHTANMNADDGFCARGDGVFNQFRIGYYHPFFQLIIGQMSQFQCLNKQISEVPVKSFCDPV